MASLAADEEEPGNKYEMQCFNAKGSYQARAEVGQGHEGEGGEEQSPSRDLCHKQGGQAENDIFKICRFERCL